MRYLSRFQHPDAALPIERSVAEVVSRLILFCKPMHRGSDFIRLGASAAGGLLVWSEYVLEWMIDGLRENPRRHARGEPVDESLQDCTRSHPRAALCFYGVPGTGKTEFGHHIAQRLDRELIVKSGSDLLSPWVGQTEQLIARMFEDAADRADEVVLLLDEVDTLLADRTRAGASWEVSHTNEFLAQMESFPGIFICTTNMVERLDAAVLRRFQFRLEFEALRAEQLLALFEQTFARTVNPSEEPALRRLAGTAVTADFANVARLLRFTPELLNGDLAALVQEEVRSRQGLTGNPRPMGFTQ